MKHPRTHYRLIALAAFALLGITASADSANAYYYDNNQSSISIQYSSGPTYYRPRPVYYAPPPVYYPPRYSYVSYQSGPAFYPARKPCHYRRGHGHHRHGGYHRPPFGAGYSGGGW